MNCNLPWTKDLVDYYEEDNIYTHLPGTNNLLALYLSRKVHLPHRQVCNRL